MSFDERAMLLLLGGAIGFILGYIVRSLREIKEELDEVDQIIKHENRSRTRNESGFMQNRLIADVAVLVVVFISAWASIVSQKASHDSQHSQDQYAAAVLCNQKIMSNVLVSLNERSTYTKAIADSNVRLQQSQADFFSVLLHKPPFSEARRSRAVHNYYDDLQEFLRLAKKGSDKVKKNPFPTIEDFSTCLRDNNHLGG